MKPSGEQLQQYFDGELDADAASAVERELGESTEAQAQLASLERLREMIVLASATRAQDLDADAMFERVSQGIDAASEQEGSGNGEQQSRQGEDRPALRVIKGGGWQRWAPVATLGLAAAAAFAFVIRPALEGSSTVQTSDNPPHQTAIMAPAARPAGSEVIEVDFGANSGTVFAVEGEAGEPIAVVWIHEDPAAY